MQFYNYPLQTIYGSHRTVEPFNPPTQNTINVYRELMTAISNHLEYS